MKENGKMEKNTVTSTQILFECKFECIILTLLFLGMGKLVMRDGSYYEGEFKNGEIFGKGYKFNKSKESEYTGDFLEGLQHGKGTLRVRKLYTYQGDFFENMRHGYGELNEFKANRNYQGQWYYNKRHGQGIQRYPDGSTYTGDWIRDKRQGHGEMEYLDGSYYDVSIRKTY
jgi:hypothetical protein